MTKLWRLMVRLVEAKKNSTRLSQYIFHLLLGLISCKERLILNIIQTTVIKQNKNNSHFSWKIQTSDQTLEHIIGQFSF